MQRHWVESKAVLGTDWENDRVEGETVSRWEEAQGEDKTVYGRG